MLHLLKRHDVGLGVSMDVIGGVRLDSRGNGTEDAVARQVRHARTAGNLLRCHHRGGGTQSPPPARHPRFLGEPTCRLRVLPLFDGPEEPPDELFEVSDNHLVVALNGLFDIGSPRVPSLMCCRFRSGSRRLRKILDQRRPVYDRRRRGESVLLIETNGDLYQTDERGNPDLRLGNVINEKLEQILASEAYADSLRRTDEKTARFCQSCRHYGFCNGYPVHAEPFTVAQTEGCPVTAAVHNHIEQYLVAAGYDSRNFLVSCGRRLRSFRCSMTATVWDSPSAISLLSTMMA